jgi:hypothetical protein
MYFIRSNKERVAEKGVCTARILHFRNLLAPSSVCGTSPAVPFELPFAAFTAPLFRLQKDMFIKADINYDVVSRYVAFSFS